MIERSRVRLPTVALSGNDSGQVVHTHVPLSPSSIIWYHQSAVMLSLAGKVTVGLVEGNGSLPPGIWLSPAGWLPIDRDQLRTQRLYRVWATFTFIHMYMYTVLPVYMRVQGGWVYSWRAAGSSATDAGKVRNTSGGANYRFTGNSNWSNMAGKLCLVCVWESYSFVSFEFFMFNLELISSAQVFVS